MGRIVGSSSPNPYYIMLYGKDSGQWASAAAAAAPGTRWVGASRCTYNFPEDGKLYEVWAFETQQDL